MEWGHFYDQEICLTASINNSVVTLFLSAFLMQLHYSLPAAEQSAPLVPPCQRTLHHYWSGHGISENLPLQNQLTNRDLRWMCSSMTHPHKNMLKTEEAEEWFQKKKKHQQNVQKEKKWECEWIVIFLKKISCNIFLTFWLLIFCMSNSLFYLKYLA